jgi:hypothetical protein
MPRKKSTAQTGGERKLGRTWHCIGYEDSLDPNWRVELEELCVSGMISPCHDKDVWSDQDELQATYEERHRLDYPIIAGEPKKPHWHLMLCFTSDKSQRQFDEIVKPLGFVRTQRTADRNAMARYFCHLDQPDKYRYAVSDCEFLGAYDPGDTMSPKWAEGKYVWHEILEIARGYEYFCDFIEYVQLDESYMDFLLKHGNAVNILRASIEDRRKKRFHEWQAEQSGYGFPFSSLTDNSSSYNVLDFDKSAPPQVDQKGGDELAL